MDSSAFTIIIRTSDQKHADLSVVFNPELTVGDLKKILEKDHPGSPEIHKQKLIHGGKVLNDKQQIKTVLNQSNAIIHLVFASEAGASGSTPGNATTPATTGLRQRHNVSANVPTLNAPQMYAAPPYAYDSVAYAQWWAQYQQHYAYMMQYYATDGGYGSPNDNEPGRGPGAGEDNQPAPAQDAEARPQIGGFMEVADDDNEGRDWLDMLFAMTRFGLLLSVIYFYSSTYRFIATLVVLFIIYMYQAGVFQVNRIPVRVQEGNAEPQQQPETDDNNNRSDDEVTTPAPRVPPTPGIFATAWCFVRSFFSSLVPTGPPAMVN